MNIKRPTHLVISIILLFIYSSIAFGQKLQSKERIPEPDHTITSRILGRDYQLYISFPKNYSTKDSISYSVLYVLDCKFCLPIIRATKIFIENDIEEFIIVGVNASNVAHRYEDYTTSISTSENEKEEKKRNLPQGSIKSRGAAKLLESLKIEIIPFVDKNYKTNDDRGIFGYSYAGLFTAHCLVNSDGHFTRFGTSSPALWWYNKKLLNQAVTQIKENKTNDLPQTKVFISIGEKEGPLIVPTMIKYSKYLEYRNYDNINLQWQIFEKESDLERYVAHSEMSGTAIKVYIKNKSKLYLFVTEQQSANC
jgi:predicted alpha/beta superfamily hydrolase